MGNVSNFSSSIYLVSDLPLSLLVEDYFFVLFWLLRNTHRHIILLFVAMS